MAIQKVDISSKIVNLLEVVIKECCLKIRGEYPHQRVRK